VVDALRLDEVRRSTPLPSAYPTRFRLRLADGSIERRRLADLPMELPRLDYARCNGLPYRYAYGVSADPKRASFADSLVKLDVETGETRVWAEDGCFPGEPVFVAAPDGHGEGARGEDQGVVLSVVLDAKTAASKLVVLDAETFEELATAAVPHGIPYGFHGVFHRTRA
jgi:carotenoid cleavage dioxygenase-like enzyme